MVCFWIQVALCEKVQGEIDEIKEAIAEQSGISSAPGMLSFCNFCSFEFA